MPKLSLDKIIFSLLCGYAFLIPFEHILEYFLGIDTVLKPYRVVAILLVIAVIISKKNTVFRISRDWKEDIFLYFIFIYGVFITLYRMVTSPFGMNKFLNSLFQMVLYLAVFVIIKNFPLTKERMIKLLWFLVGGLIINAIYIYKNFYIFKSFDRQSGFMDNPNFVAVSLVVAIVFLVHRLDFIRSFTLKSLLFGVVIFLLYVFSTTRSRTGLAILAVAGTLIFLFGSLPKKILIAVGGIAVLVLFLVPRNAFDDEIGTSNILIRRIVKSDASDDPRLPLWRGALRAAQASNFLGLGIGQFRERFREFLETEHHYLIYRAVTFGGTLSVHSDYLAILTNYGLAGMTSYIIFLWLSLRKVGLQMLNAADTSLSVLNQFKFIVLVCLIVFGITTENFLSPIYWLLLAISTKTTVA